MGYLWLADILAGLHLLWVAVVFFGLLLILVGGPLGWAWVRNPWVRGIHLAMIVGVVVRTVFASECPITVWERECRIAVGHYYFNDEGNYVITYPDSPWGKLAHDIIHPPPEWLDYRAYPPIYAAFAVLVLASFWLVPVRRGRAEEPASDSSHRPAADADRG